MGKLSTSALREGCGLPRHALARQAAHCALGSGPSFTCNFPKFSPRRSPMKARGAWARPSTMSSLYLRRPERTHFQMRHSLADQKDRSYRRGSDDEPDVAPIWRMAGAVLPAKSET